MNAWVKKEIYDSVRWTPLGLGISTLVLWYFFRTTNWNNYHSLSSSLFFLVWFIAGGFAAFLGLATYLPDTFGSARSYLVHRGLSPTKIFQIRMFVNFLVYLVTMLIPILGVAVYLYWMGPTHAPATPKQVVPSIVIILFSFAFFFGGILVACRPARWFGTRVLPLAFSWLVSVTATVVFAVGGPLFPFVFLPLGLVGMYVLVRASKLAFICGPTRPAPSSPLRRPWAEVLLLLGSVLITSVVVAFAASSILVPAIASHKSVSIQFARDGIPWLVETNYNYSERGRTSTRVLTSLFDTEAVTKPEPNELISGANVGIYSYGYYPSYWDMTLIGSGFGHMFYDHGGLVYVYGSDPLNKGHLEAVVGKNGFQSNNFDGLEPFSCDLRKTIQPIQLGRQSSNTLTWNANASRSALLLSSSDGVYAINAGNQSIKKVVDGPVHSATILDSRMYVRSDDSIDVYAIEPNENDSKSSIGERIATLSIPREFVDSPNQSSAEIHFKDANNWTMLISKLSASQGIHVTECNENKTTSRVVDSPVNIGYARPSNSKEQVAVSLSLPPGTLCIGAAAARWYQDPNIEQQVARLYGLVVLQAAVSAALAWFAARRRGLSLKQSIAWCVAGLFVGLLTWGAILGLYPKVYYLMCHSCGKKRRIENERCDSCQAPWESLEPTGIELIESEISNEQRALSERVQPV